MSRADPVIEDLTRGATAWLTQQDGNELDAYQAYSDAAKAMTIAEKASNPAQYANAIAKIRTSQSSSFQTSRTRKLDFVLQKFTCLR